MDLDQETLELWRDFVADRCGMSFSDTRLRVLARSLDDRVKAGGYRNRTDYYHAVTALPNGGPEWQALYQLLLNNETRFFRDTPAFTALTHHVLPEVRKRDRATLDVWSAGCSTGQEAYSLAMTCLDADWQHQRPIRVVGTDVNPENLAKATAGRYRRFEAQTLSVSHRKRYFVTHECGDVEVLERLRSVVKFQPYDLTKAIRTPPPHDVIFCQNVLIYYTVPVRTEILRRLTSALATGGYLFLGAAEAVGLPTPGLELVRLSDTWIYRRTAV
jgi:chemotaxis methyl-accepting protein methylase